VSGVCDGQVVIVTGAGRGIGRAHALAFAAQGARVVVNDLGTTYEGEGTSGGPADDVVAEIKAMGGEAVANFDDVADPVASGRIVQTALDTFGDLHTVVNNAGFLRIPSYEDLNANDMDLSWGVHVMGAFNLTKHATDQWIPRVDAGEKLNASIVNTSSAAGLWPVGSTPYATVKAAVAALTMVMSATLLDKGIRINAIAPGGRTRMNTDAITDQGGVGVPPPPDEGFDRMDPSNVSPLVVWLSTPEAADVTGRVFESGAGRISVANGWTHGPEAFRDDRAWDPAELGPIVHRLIEEAPPAATMAGN
jgi:NAD(P)-dependent dehydrogenase (short-subunit alcohol dehydrogenase family)